MPKFIIEPHFRLQEWVAEDKGYFKDEGLDYIFRERVQSTEGATHDTPTKVGAYQSIEAGRKADVSCACHWTIGVAASAGHGKLFGELYSVSPAAIFVHPECNITSPEQLAGVPISVGYQSGSHYSTVQAMEQYLKPEQINLSFNDGLLFKRMELLLEHKVPAVHLFSGPYYFAEQLGFRKVIDTTFMMAMMVHADPALEDLRKYARGLKRAQRDIDQRPELYTHYYKKEFPVRWHGQMDTRRWGPGERIVFEPYEIEVFNDMLQWVSEHHIFTEGDLGSKRYDQSVLRLVS